MASGGKIDVTVTLDVDDRTRQVLERLGWVSPTEATELRRALERWESGQRRKGLPTVESVPDGIRYAALLVRAIGTEGGEAVGTPRSAPRPG